MKLTISAALLSFAGLVMCTAVSRQPCPEAVRFGILSVSPTTLNPGDVCFHHFKAFLKTWFQLWVVQDITISVDLNCAINNFGIIPKFLDFSIVVPGDLNNGHEPNIVLARRDFDSSTGSTSDQFTTKVRQTYQVIRHSGLSGLGSLCLLLCWSTLPNPSYDHVSYQRHWRQWGGDSGWRFRTHHYQCSEWSDLRKLWRSHFLTFLDTWGLAPLLNLLRWAPAWYTLRCFTLN